MPDYRYSGGCTIGSYGGWLSLACLQELLPARSQAQAQPQKMKDGVSKEFVEEPWRRHAAMWEYVKASRARGGEMINGVDCAEEHSDSETGDKDSADLLRLQEELSSR